MDIEGGDEMTPLIDPRSRNKWKLESQKPGVVETYWLSSMWIAHGDSWGAGCQKGRYSHSRLPGLHSINQLLPLGAGTPGRDAKLPGGVRRALAAQRGRPVVGTPAEVFSPNHSCGMSLDACLVVWPLLTPLYFPISDSLASLLLLWVPYWFSKKFPFCQVSQVGFYCLHPVIWSSSSMASAPALVSRRGHLIKHCV